VDSPDNVMSQQRVLRSRTDNRRSDEISQSLGSGTQMLPWGSRRDWNTIHQQMLRGSIIETVISYHGEFVVVDKMCNQIATRHVRHMLG